MQTKIIVLYTIAYTAPINVSVTVLGPQMALVQWFPPTTWTHCITGYSVVSNYSSIITNATNITLHNLLTNTTISVAGVDSGNRLTPKANVTVLYSVLHSHTPSSSSSSIGVSTSHADIPTTMDVTSSTGGGGMWAEHNCTPSLTYICTHTPYMIHYTIITTVKL